MIHKPINKVITINIPNNKDGLGQDNVEKLRKLIRGVLYCIFAHAPVLFGRGLD